jgi:folate-binding protein YgfZ
VIVASSLDLVWCEGRDAATFLQGQVSQDVDSIAPGETRYTLVLQPQGKVEVFGRLTRVDDSSFVLDVEAGHGEAALARLARFKLRVEIDLRLEPAVPMLAVRDDDLQVDDTRLYLVAPWPRHAGFDLVVDGDATAVPSDTTEALEVARIEAGVPRLGTELDDSTIPAEAGQWLIDSSVSFTKGCYTGQELVARVDSRGSNTPRHLRRFRFDAAAPVAGSPIVVDGAVVGALTSSAGQVALGYVSRGAVEATTALVGDDGESHAGVERV